MGFRERLQNATGFQWDAGNLEKISRAHGVEFWESEEIFFNQPFVVSPHQEHSTSEERCFGLGKTDLGRRLLVVFTLRGNEIRVISARDMSRKERTVFEKHENESQEGSEVPE